MRLIVVICRLYSWVELWISFLSVKLVLHIHLLGELILRKEAFRLVTTLFL